LTFDSAARPRNQPTIFDHAHFIRDFRAVAGRTPAQYERETVAR